MKNPRSSFVRNPHFEGKSDMIREHRQTSFTQLLEDYCRSVGMGDFEIEPEGGMFEIDDIAVTVTHDDEFDRITLMGAVGSLTPEEMQSLAPSLLQLNVALGAMGGFSFCADLERGALQLQRSAPLEAMDSERFDVELAEMAGKCRAARDLIATLGEGPAAARQLLEQAGRADSSLVTFRI